MVRVDTALVAVAAVAADTYGHPLARCAVGCGWFKQDDNERRDAFHEPMTLRLPAYYVMKRLTSYL